MSRAKKRASGFPPAPRAGKTVGDIKRVLPGSGNSSERICWRFGHVDEDGPWGLNQLTTEELGQLFAKLRSVETQTINELFHRGGEPGKHYDTERIPNNLALERLTAKRLGDMTQISRLRFGGTERLYGFLVENVFHVVWWDREHEVWPSVKKNT